MDELSRELMDPVRDETELSSSPPDVPATVVDLEFLYRIFLGREWEVRDEQERRGDGRLTMAVADIARDIVASSEFKTTVSDPMMAGEPLEGWRYSAILSAEHRNWMASRLPMSAQGLESIAASTSWYEALRAIFADPAFRQRALTADSAAGSLGDAPAPPLATVATRLEDLATMYEVFLGRPWEVSSEDDRRADGRIGRPVGLAAYDVIASSEFRRNIFDRMMAGQPVQGPIFASRPGLGYRTWIVTRLPLEAAARAAVLKAVCWYQVHRAVFGDPIFRKEMLGDLKHLARLGKAVLSQEVEAAMIAGSLLFERDYYLDAYKDVAASGGDPLQHFLLHGVAEGRNPNRVFDTRWYLSAYPDVYLGGLNPLTHYIVAGAELGYDPHPFLATKDINAAVDAIDGHDLLPFAEFLHYILPADPARYAAFGPYDVHRATERNVRQSQLPEIARHIEVMTVRPHFVVLIEGEDVRATTATRKSLDGQLYANVDVIGSLGEAARFANGQGKAPAYFMWLDAGDRLAPDALYEIASALNADPSLDLVYFDHEVALAGGLHRPAHKPAWSPDYLEAFDYIGPAACFDLSLAAGFFKDVDGRYDLILRMTERTARIAHIGKVLLSRPSEWPAKSIREKQAADIHAIEGRLKRTGRQGTVSVNAAESDSYDVRIHLANRPLVSALIPTAARVIDYEGREIDLIVACLESITARSTYENIEFIIVDNGDFDRDRIKHIDIERLKIVTYSLPEVNIAKKINLAASHASGEVFLILNDDIEPLVDDWIERMLGHLEKPHVGLVGAKLVYPNNTLQHAGVVLRRDCLPDHVRRGFPRDDDGHAYSSCGVRNYLAVTGAVSMMRAQDFWDVGGYSQDLPIDYNDIDFSYKIAKSGYSIVYEPKAELTHYESVSVVKPPRPQDAQLFLKEWAAVAEDPYYNHHDFADLPPTFDLAYTERSH